eukprot:SAG31_NODE_4042_length_3642_cov_2.065481_4_plen_62_part_00
MLYNYLLNLVDATERLASYGVGLAEMSFIIAVKQDPSVAISSSPAKLCSSSAPDAPVEMAE